MPSSPTLAVRLGRSAGRSSGLRSLAAACTWSHGRGGGPNEAITLEGLRRLESSVPRHYTWLSTWHWYCDTSYSFVVCVVVCAHLEFASDSLVNLDLRMYPRARFSAPSFNKFSAHLTPSHWHRVERRVTRPTAGTWQWGPTARFRILAVGFRFFELRTAKMAVGRCWGCAAQSVPGEMGAETRLAARGHIIAASLPSAGAHLTWHSVPCPRARCRLSSHSGGSGMRCQFDSNVNREDIRGPQVKGRAAPSVQREQ